jgi:integrase
MPTLMRKPPKYCHGFVDRHGKARWYFRRPGYKRVALPGLPWSPEFMAAYEAATAGESTARVEVGSDRTKPGSFSALVVAYYRSADFARLAESTKNTYRGIIERLRAGYGDKPIAKLERHHVAAMIDSRAKTPAAANNALRILRMLMGFALDRSMITSDPTWQVKKVRNKTEGHRTWTEEDIAAFEAAWRIGTKQRLALALLLYTAQRRSDVVLMGPQHVRGGRLQFRQRKTGTEINIPIHPELARIVAATPCGNLTFLVTEYGKPRTPAGFTTWFVECARKAGLPPESTPHGLRKAASRRLAEALRSGHEIMAVTGHKSLKEVTRYTEAASQARLADTAIAALSRFDPEDETGT